MAKDVPQEMTSAMKPWTQYFSRRRSLTADKIRIEVRDPIHGPTNDSDVKIGQLRINSLESLNAPKAVMEFYRNIGTVKITPVESEAGKLRDQFGPEWTAQTVRKLINVK